MFNTKESHTEETEESKIYDFLKINSKWVTIGKLHREAAGHGCSQGIIMELPVSVLCIFLHVCYISLKKSFSSLKEKYIAFSTLKIVCLYYIIGFYKSNGQTIII